MRNLSVDNWIQLGLHIALLILVLIRLGMDLTHFTQ